MNTNCNNEDIPIKKIPNDDRLINLKQFFVKEFYSEPMYFVRVPGRVNIIGEHIDYCGYPVLPMALEQDILIAAGLIPSTELKLRNTNGKYESFNVNITSFEDIEIKPDDNGKPFWYNYVLCGIKGAMEYMNNKIINGIQLCIDGNIPPASGLSSSSALVSASCLSFLYAQNVTLSKTNIASLCANSERYIGTQGGGMDQAIAFLAEKYSAQYITWQPLKAIPVALPEDAAFVVAHSLAEANKAATNDFNRRVIECRLAAKVLAISTGALLDNKVITLSQVQKILANSLEDMIKLVHKYLPSDIYKKTELCNILNVTEDEMNNVYLSPNTKYLTDFKLKQRALHVYEEAMRVEKFRDTCIQAKNEINCMSELNINNTLDVLGKLMVKSHESLKELYECSHENLDRLVDISKDINVYSRLTGAGWGGCVVALCPKDQVETYIETIKEKFYVNYCNIDKNKASQLIFATTPNHGAVIYINK